jgi:NAD(P)-dependent dehydrogenase (short-subunit alcohol dehydrogenase family)
MNHGVFTFGDDAKTSYERMIQLVTEAENYLQSQGTIIAPSSSAEVKARENHLELARIRKSVCDIKGAAMIAQLDSTAKSVNFSNRADVASIATRGPLTPDHVIRTKPIPVILGENARADIARYADAYCEYFERNTNGQLMRLNPAPCWGVWPGFGLISFGRGVKEAQIISDIKDHTIDAIDLAEQLGGWVALPESDIFDMEYWELEQAKLRKGGTSPILQGQIALVTGAASGIGRACVEALHAQGAAVVALDLDQSIMTLFGKKDILGVVCDVTLDESIQAAVEIGGLDILISNAGNFPASEKIADINPKRWDESLALNLTSHQRLLKVCTPYLAMGVDAAVIMIASKNVPAPGPGACAYSVAKAGQTQLARVAALELGGLGVRVNVIHPNAVFDTALWTSEVLEKRAQHYGMSVEEYKTNNVLKTEVTSKDVAALACAMAGPIFAKTTGAQVPIDGGNERVI